MKNESKIQRDEKRCYLCGRLGATDKHHIFNGTAYRSKSEEDKMYIFVHRSCHHMIHNDAKLLRDLKEIGQMIWELEGSREDFIKRYGKSYIKEEQDVRQRQSAEDNAGDPADEGERQSSHRLLH